MIKMAIPNKGRLYEPTIELLGWVGINIDNGDSRKLFARCKNVEIAFARASDIPVYVEKGVVDLGITGLDRVLERGAKVEDVLDLRYGECTLVLAGKKGSAVKDGSRVATSFPNLTSNYFNKIGKKAEIIRVAGAVESMPKVGLAELIVDLTSTGRTLKDNGLVVLDTILESSTRVICRKLNKESEELVKKMREAVR